MSNKIHQSNVVCNPVLCWKYMKWYAVNIQYNIKFDNSYIMALLSFFLKLKTYQEHKLVLTGQGKIGKLHH